MATLPFCCERVREDKREELEELHGLLKDYMDQRPAVAELLAGALEVAPPLHLRVLARAPSQHFKSPRALHCTIRAVHHTTEHVPRLNRPCVCPLQILKQCVI